jgi:hypothetical protein
MEDRSWKKVSDFLRTGFVFLIFYYLCIRIKPRWRNQGTNYRHFGLNLKGWEPMPLGEALDF